MLTLNDGRKELYQWDTGRIATIDIDCDVVHFSNLKYGDSLAVEVKEGEAAIPNKLLMSGAQIYCWAFAKDDSGAYTKQEQTLPVIKRAKPSDYVYTETETLTWKSLDERITELEKGGTGGSGIDGEDGATFIPYVSESGIISWTNDKGLRNPEPVNIKGEPGKDGINGRDGVDGKDGKNGADGTTPHIGENGNWFIGDTDTGVPAKGEGASVMVGATSETDGTSGLVPAPAAGDQGKFLAGDGTWKTPASSGGGTDLSLGVSGAAVGQTVRITAVDDGGKPTAWEAVDVTAGDTDGSWVKLLDLTTEEDTNKITHTFKDSPMKKIIVTIDTLAASKNTDYCPVTVMTGANAETAFYVVKYYPYPIPTTVAARSTYIVEFVDDGENVNTMITTSYQPIRGGNVEYVGQGNPVMAKMLWKAVDGYNAEPNPNITGFMVITYATFAAGTIIKIWGIPA